MKCMRFFHVRLFSMDGLNYPTLPYIKLAIKLLKTIYGWSLKVKTDLLLLPEMPLILQCMGQPFCIQGIRYSYILLYTDLVHHHIYCCCTATGCNQFFTNMYKSTFENRSTLLIRTVFIGPYMFLEQREVPLYLCTNTIVNMYITVYN